MQRRSDEYQCLRAQMEEAKTAGKQLQAEIKELEKDKLALLSKQKQQRTDYLDAAAALAAAARIEQSEVKAVEAGVKEELKAVINMARGSPPTPDCADENADEHANMDVRNVQVKRDSQGAQQGGSEASAGPSPKKHKGLDQDDIEATLRSVIDETVRASLIEQDEETAACGQVVAFVRTT